MSDEELLRLVDAALANLSAATPPMEPRDDLRDRARRDVRLGLERVREELAARRDRAAA